MQSDINSNHDYVDARKIDTCISTDPPTEKVDASNSSEDSNNELTTETAAATGLTNTTERKDEPTPDENYPRGGRYNLRPNPNPSFSDSCRF